jgi:hypothetical protein
MFKKKKGSVERRKGERRKPGDQRFTGRLVGLKKGKTRKGADRRRGDRRKGKS